MEYGEINPSEIPAEVTDGFIEFDEATGRAFYIPDVIKVHGRKGEAYQGRFHLNPENGNAIEETAEVEPSAQLGARAVVGALSYVGLNVCVGKQVIIEDKVKIFKHVIIGDKAKIGRRTSIGPFAVIGRKSLVASRCTVESGAVVPDYEFVPARTCVTADTTYDNTPQ